MLFEKSKQKSREDREFYEQHNVYSEGESEDEELQHKLNK